MVVMTSLVQLRTLNPLRDRVIFKIHKIYHSYHCSLFTCSLRLVLELHYFRKQGLAEHSLVGMGLAERKFDVFVDCRLLVGCSLTDCKVAGQFRMKTLVDC
jgi:hypothetical protein